MCIAMNGMDFEHDEGLSVGSALVECLEHSGHLWTLNHVLKCELHPVGGGKEPHRVLNGSSITQFVFRKVILAVLWRVD